MPPRKATGKLENNFNMKASFPNCIGAIDGKHIRIIRPCDSGCLYYNYKKYVSINILAVCNLNYEYIHVDVGSYGKSSDSTIYCKSSFCNEIQEKLLGIRHSRTSSNNKQRCASSFCTSRRRSFSLIRLCATTLRWQQFDTQTKSI